MCKNTGEATDHRSTSPLPMNTLKTRNANWLAAARKQARLSDDVAALADRIARNQTRGTADMQELWRLVRIARELGA